MPDIQLPVFQGPLNLLLRLIEREDLDITAVSLVAVTDQYLTAIHSGSGFDPQALADFVAIGAKLVYLKSRALLPPLPPIEGEDAEEDDVGRELVDMLLEFRRFAEIADLLQERQKAGLRTFPRTVAAPARPEGPGLDGVTMEAMRKIMEDVLKRIPEAPRVVMRRETLTLHDRVRELRHELLRRGRFSFREAISRCQTRVEVVVAFLAVLELLKGGECEARQDAAWGDIEVVALAPVAV